jgi:hypothetical protein
LIDAPAIASQEQNVCRFECLSDGLKWANLSGCFDGCSLPTFLRFGAILCKEESHFMFMNKNTLFAYVQHIAMWCKTLKM